MRATFSHVQRPDLPVFPCNLSCSAYVTLKRTCNLSWVDSIYCWWTPPLLVPPRPEFLTISSLIFKKFSSLTKVCDIKRLKDFTPPAGHKYRLVLLRNVAPHCVTMLQPEYSTSTLVTLLLIVFTSSTGAGARWRPLYPKCNKR